MHSQEDVLYYGGRKADKLVRCYHKDEVKAFRIEIELHSGLLRRNNISKLDDFLYLCELVHPKHFQFVDLDRKRLKGYLTSKFGDEGHRIFKEAIKRATSLRRLRRYFKRKKIVNVHRFLVPIALNQEVIRALDRWARNFKEGAL